MLWSLRAWFLPENHRQLKRIYPLSLAFSGSIPTKYIIMNEYLRSRARLWKRMRSRINCATLCLGRDIFRACLFRWWCFWKCTIRWLLPGRRFHSEPKRDSKNARCFDAMWSNFLFDSHNFELALSSIYICQFSNSIQRFLYGRHSGSFIVHSRRCSLDAKPLHVSHLCGLRRKGLLPLVPHPQTSAATPLKPKVPVTRFISSFAAQTVNNYYLYRYYF